MYCFVLIFLILSLPASKPPVLVSALIIIAFLFKNYFGLFTVGKKGLSSVTSQLWPGQSPIAAQHAVKNKPTGLWHQIPSNCRLADTSLHNCPGSSLWCFSF